VTSVTSVVISLHRLLYHPHSLPFSVQEPEEEDQSEDADMDRQDGPHGEDSAVEPEKGDRGGKDERAYRHQEDYLDDEPRVARAFQGARKDDV